MQEQLAIYAFLWIVFELIRDWKINSNRCWNILFVVVASLGILSAKLAPGNGARFTKEVMTWFPNFPNLSSVKKLGLGILETGDGLLSVSFTFVFLFLIVLIILAFYKRNLICISLCGFVLLSILSQKFEWRSIFFTISDISKLARETGTFQFNLVYCGAVLYYVIILGLVLFVILRMAEIFYKNRLT